MRQLDCTVTEQYFPGNSHTSVMNMNLTREGFTRRGLHLRNSGKDKLLACLTEKIKGQQCKPTVGNPISLTWKELTPKKFKGKQSAAKTALQTLPCKRRRKKSNVEKH